MVNRFIFKVFYFAPDLIRSITRHLSLRKQFIEYGGFKAQIYIAICDVPHGSNLGPLLFLMFINDIISYFHDLKIYNSVNNINYGFFTRSNQLYRVVGKMWEIFQV